MSSALAVQPRHLDLPLGSCFRPEELIIAPSTTRAEYQKLGAGLSKLAMADKLWQCDFALWGMKRFGADEGLRLAREATSLSAGLLERCARIAKDSIRRDASPDSRESTTEGCAVFPLHLLTSGCRGLHSRA